MEPTLLLVDDETAVTASLARVFMSTVCKLLSKPCSYAAIQTAMYEVFCHCELTLKNERLKEINHPSKIKLESPDHELSSILARTQLTPRYIHRNSRSTASN